MHIKLSLYNEVSINLLNSGCSPRIVLGANQLFPFAPGKPWPRHHLRSVVLIQRLRWQ